MSEDITKLLSDWKNGDKEALDKLIAIVYNELYKIASNRLSQERSDHTLQATALVNEACLRLAKWDSADWQNRTHFFAVAAQVMRNILVDYARKQMADKRISAKNKISLDELTDQIEDKEMYIIALDDVLNDFAKVDPQQSKIIELRFFGGLTIKETAEVM